MIHRIHTRVALLLLWSLVPLCFLRAQLSNDTYQYKWEQQSSEQVLRTLVKDYERLKPFFEEAYGLYPSIPRGILEAVSFTYSRFNDLYGNLSL